MRRALIRMTLEALGAALHLQDGEEVIGVFRAPEDQTNDTFSIIIRGTSKRIPEVMEGCVIPYIALEWKVPE